jgi:hypothetical protein
MEDHNRNILSSLDDINIIENEIFLLPSKKRRLNDILFIINEVLEENRIYEDNMEEEEKEEEEDEIISNISEKIYEYEKKREEYRIEHNLYADEEEDIDERDWYYAESEDDLNYGYISDNDNYDNYENYEY